MKTITWQQGADLCKEIRSLPLGDWTHDLNVIRNGPARIINRALSPEGQEIVYFRGDDYAGAWPGANWDRFAVQRLTTQEIEQLTLF
ncbi:hypothetical protein EJP82_00995 [Paenibacillus anaericanus]|uniref:Uncharacterized protein n=1 Tax=Paenibacillus anaericanus TaxID=170367 RepID=A0A433YFC4_9BACL|nr:hypothetical protein [Paenibacillus anaericanus]RUT48551.1 hypothetical protein EJP82_00995 [Paenibacillus anaericanus]